MVLISPLSVPQTKTKNFILNLNVYRNAHFHVLNKAKINYKAIMLEQIIKLNPINEPMCITYTLYPKRLCDISNILTVHDKFFCDALTELNKIPDDNYKYVPKVFFEFGEVDKVNPRVEISINVIKETHENHHITR